MYPPTGTEFPHATGIMKHRVYIEYLLNYRVGYDELENEEAPPAGKLYPVEHEILEELQTEEARYYIGTWLKSISPNFWEIRDHMAKQGAVPS
ncbi:hypothetical protein C0995_008421, partial [Termitomyces sp. Mi166